MEQINAEVFVTVASMGSYRKAADELGYTQAGISYIINAMEEKCGFKLFEREYGGVRLTAEGEELLPVMKRLFHTEKDVDAKINDIRGLETGHIRLISFNTAIVCLLPDVLMEFREQYPNIDIEVLACDNPKKAVSMSAGHSVIDQDACIKCGRCIAACPYHAIIHQERPCEKACGVGAIHPDKYGRAEIDQNKCVACGMCLVSCPFAAIVDKSQIFQTIKAIQSDTPVYAIVAPAIAGQFGKDFTQKRIRSAFKALGFTDVAEVAVGADLCTIEEAKDFLREVPDKLRFMGTSCCPAWAMMAKKNFPDYAENISMTLTPMVLTARLLKEHHPECKIAFIGPCLSKKQEASRRSVKSYVDFCLTFEELGGMFIARDVDFTKLPEDEPLHEASADGRGFAKSGGVAQAVVNYIKKIDPDREVKVEQADGLANCKKMMMIATKTHKYDGYLLEGMGCPGGCIAGAGVIQPAEK